MVSKPEEMPERMSVSMRSPIMIDSSECASMWLSAERIIKGLGLPMNKGAFPVAFSMRAAIDPVAGTMPDSVGPVASGLVAIKRAPPIIRRIALVTSSKL